MTKNKTRTTAKWPVKVWSTMKRFYAKKVFYVRAYRVYTKYDLAIGSVYLTEIGFVYETDKAHTTTDLLDLSNLIYRLNEKHGYDTDSRAKKDSIKKQKMEVDIRRLHKRTKAAKKK